MSGAVEGLRKLDGEATPGPWEWDLYGTHGEEASLDARKTDDGLGDGVLYHSALWPIKSANAALIAEARNALPALLDAAETLQAMVEDGHPCSGADASGDEWWRRAREVLARLSDDREGAQR